MSIERTVYENGEMLDGGFGGFEELDDEERELERCYLDACLLAENAMEETEKQTQPPKPNKDKDSLSELASKENDPEMPETRERTPECESVKMEFSSSQEHIVEPNMDYTLDDIVEICSIPSEDDEDETEDVLTNILKEQKVNDQINCNIIDDTDDDDDDEKLSTVFNDHTYTSQEVATINQTQDKNENLRQNIIKHIVKKRSMEANGGGGIVMRDDDASCGSGNDSDIEESAIEDIKNFVDQILEGKIEDFVLKPSSTTGSEKSNNTRVKIEPNNENIHTEDFIQNVINAVADEDAADYAAEQTILKSIEKELAIGETPEKGSCLNNVETENLGEQNDDRTETCSFQSFGEDDCEQVVDKEKSNKEKSFAKIHENEQEENVIRMETSDYEVYSQSANEDDGGQLESISTLPDFCSEPLEITSLEERFGSFEAIADTDVPLEKSDENLDNTKERNEQEVPIESCAKQAQDDGGIPAESSEISEKQLEEKHASIDVVEKPSDEKNTCDKNDAEDIEKTPSCIAQVEEPKITKEIPEIEDNNLNNSNTPNENRTTIEEDNNQLEKTSNEKENINVNQSQIEISFEEVESSLGIDFDRAMKVVETSYSISPLFKELNALVTEMHNDCEKFSMATSNIDSRLRDYITDKFEIMQALARRFGRPLTNTIERGSQTEPKLSKKHLRKLNKKNKKDLLASTDSSSSQSSSDDDDDEMEKSNGNKSLLINSNHLLQGDENIEEKNTKENDTPIQAQTTIKDEVTPESVYDDGVCLEKYLRSVVFTTPSNEIGDDKASITSSRSRSSSISSLPANGASQVSQSKSDKDKNTSNQKAKKLAQADDDDKEINRLINLDGLMKRHNNSAGNTKQTDVDKQKNKSNNPKSKTDGVLEFLENNLPKESLSSDESANENEEDVITEKQYLNRYNQDLKNQLLNDSSNASSQNEEDGDDFEPAMSEESESGNKSPLVDKFLKTYNLEDSDDGDGDVEMANDATMANNKIEIKANVTEDKKLNNEIEAEAGGTKKEIEDQKDGIITKASDDSDCELLNDSFIYRKRSQPKSLEKILNEAEKRKKIQKLDDDLISLSSESALGSDVEAVEIEPAGTAKSRAIKPMLRPDQLQRETVKAQKSETERLRRLEKRQSMLSKLLTEHKELNTDAELVLDYNDATKTFIKVHPGLVSHLKPHQRDGVRFMYDSCYGGVDALKRNHGSGCILAHCMGLGKTLQLIALMHTVISYKELKTEKILVLCPKSTVMNWGDEIARWLFPLRTKNLKVYTFNDTSDINEKLSIMREWSMSSYQKAGCLLIGYEAFRTLVFYHKYKNRNNLDTTRLEKIRNLINEYLLQPGADLVVCDEGHIIKNSKSAISLAVAEIKTQKRIVLTGTPIQNNLKEYYSMVNFIKPLFLGTEKEFANLYANPIKNGQHKDSNKRDIKHMKARSFVLHKKLSKFVQRKEAELLKSFLPKKFEYVLFIPMTNVQNKLYERILETINSRQDHRGRSLITDYTCLRKIWTHPKVLEDAWKNAVNQQYKRDARKQPNSDDDQPDDIYDSQTGFMSVKNDWWRHLIAENDLESILPSNKLRTMFEILRMCEENGDKCLIFSAFVAVLNVVEYFFKKLAVGHKETLGELNMSQGTRSTWESNKDYFRLDGKTSKSTRHEMIKRFNHPQNTRARVFLISAKAGGQGINLIGANRVIILDTSWNPSNDQQNIFRIFRLGQKKNCYIYRLLALGTMEEKVYSRSVTKQAMSFRVMDVQQIDRHYSMAELAELYTLTIPNYSERPTPIFPQDTILANLLRSFPDLVYKYHEHDSLLENQVEQELSEQEKIDAWNAYENDLQMNSQMANMEEMQMKMSQGGNMANYMGTGGSIPPPGLNLQFLNYRNMNPRDNPSNFMNPSLLQYNYPNQQYLDLMNNYRQYSTPEALNAVAAAYSSMNPSMYPPSVSPHLTSNTNATAHPLSALSEFSMYGLGMNSASTSAAAVAAAAAAAQLAQLPPTSSNASSMYATPNMQTQAANAAGLFSNQQAIYQTLQKLGYGGAGGGTPNNGPTSLLTSPSLNSYTNSVPFPAPRLTPPQSMARKSSTPDLIAYRTSGGSVSMPALTPPSVPTLTTLPTQQVETKKTANNSSKNIANNNVNNQINTEATNLSSKGIDVNTKNAANKTIASTSTTKTNAIANNINTNSTIRTTTTDSNATFSQSRQISTTNLTSTNKSHTTTSKDALSKTSSRPPTITPSSSTPLTTTTTTTTTTKPADPQIRVKDIGQLCANTNNRTANMQAAAAKEVRNTFNNVTNSSNISANNNNTTNIPRQNKQSAIDNRLLTATTSSTAAELLKARSEMQIIPTTNPPGTSSISKQLSEISPSISLTALRTTSNAITGSNMAANINSTKKNRINSPATITSSTIGNRQQTTTTAASNVQSRKTINNTNSINYSSANLSNLTSNSKNITSPTTVTTSMPNLQQSRKAPTNNTTTSMAAPMMVPSSSSNKNLNIASNKTSIGSGNGNTATKNAKYNTAPTTTRTNMATITPTATVAQSSGKSVPNILRNHHIRKMPSPLPTTTTTTTTTISNNSNNMNITVKDAANSNQYQTNGNAARATFAANTKAVSAATTTGGNIAQIIYNSKNSTTAQRSFSPTTTTTTTTPTTMQSQHTSQRTGSPAKSSSMTIERISPNSGQNTLAAQRTNPKIPTPTTLPLATTAFPVHLQRSNSALGTTRTVSPLSVSAKSPNLTNSTASILTPKITKVTSLRTSSSALAISTLTATPTLTTPVSTAARVAAFKKTPNNNSKAAKQLQTLASPAIKAAAASSVVQQKRLNISGNVVPTQLNQNQITAKQRINAQSNGRSLNMSNPSSRILVGDTQISGVNVRPTLKQGSAITTNSYVQSTGYKRTVIGGPQPTSASSLASVKLPTLERKRKALDISSKQGIPNKRPKES